MKKIFLILTLVIITSILLILSLKEDNMSVEAISSIINNYTNSGFVSLRNDDSDEYLKYMPPNHESILDYEILYDKDTCLMIFFFSKEVSRETIYTCHDFFTKFILMDARALGDPYVISMELRASLPNKEFKAYIGKELAIDYQFVQKDVQKDYSIIRKELNEDIDNIYNQRKIQDEFSNYIKSHLNNLGYKGVKIEKSFNNNFLIIRLKNKDIHEAKLFFESSDFVEKLNLSKHDFINEIRIIQTSVDNKVTIINLNIY